MRTATAIADPLIQRAFVVHESRNARTGFCIWSGWFVYLNYTRQMNKINPPRVSCTALATCLTRLVPVRQVTTRENDSPHAMAIHRMELHRPFIHSISRYLHPVSDRSPANAYCDRLPLAHPPSAQIHTVAGGAHDTTHRPPKISVVQHADDPVCCSDAPPGLHGRKERPLGDTIGRRVMGWLTVRF